MLSKIKQIAKEYGYDGAVEVGNWHGYSIYNLIFNDGVTRYIGPPLKILVKDNEVKISTYDEAMAILDDAIGEKE